MRLSRTQIQELERSLSAIDDRETLKRLLSAVTNRFVKHERVPDGSVVLLPAGGCTLFIETRAPDESRLAEMAIKNSKKTVFVQGND